VSLVARLVYVSTARPDLTKKDIESILDTARERNGRDNVTGLLVFDGISFMQLLEGEAEIIDAVFRDIANDNRHSNVVRILQDENVPRQFKEWSMGYSMTHDPRMLKGDSWFPLTSKLLDKALPANADSTVRSLFTSFLSVDELTRA